jgi:glycosyltransferase involved in cell wall biosynthesis
MKYKIYSLLNDIWYQHLRSMASQFFHFLALIFEIANQHKYARNFCERSLRYKVRPKAISLFKNIISKYPYLTNQVSTGITLAGAAERSIIIKWPEEKEGVISKGVIVVTFTKTFSFFIRNIDLNEINKYFYFALEPSWSGYADADIFSFYNKMKHVIVQSSEIEDRILLNSFKETFIPVSFGASDWVDTKIFKPIDSPKIYDSIYIANTNPAKRVIRYLNAIKNIVAQGNPYYVGCLVCASWGGAQELIHKIVAEYNLEKNIILKFSLSRQEVIEHLNASKVNILLSFKEGSNRSLFEAIFCNIPVICISENTGVNKSYINEYTGLLTPDAELENSLLWMKDNYFNYSPRNWAELNISPKATTQKLSAVINQLDKDFEGNEESTFIKTNNPEVSYFDYPTLDHKIFTEKVFSLFLSSTKENNCDIPQSLRQLKDQFFTLT